MSLSKNIASSYAGQILAIVCNFLTSILVAIVLGVQVFGSYSLYTNSLNFFLLLLGLGIPSAIIYFVGRKKIDAPFFLLIVILLIISGIVLWSCIVWLVYHFNIEKTLFPDFLDLPNTKIIFGIHVILQLVLSLGVSFLNGNKMFVKTSVIVSMGSMLILLFNIGYYFFLKDYFNNDVINIIWINIISSFIQVIIVYCCIYIDKSHLVSTLVLDSTSLKSLFTYSFIFYIGNLIQFLNYKMDLWFLNYYSSIKDVGIYALAGGLAQLLWVLPNAIHSVVYSYSSTLRLSKSKNNIEMVISLFNLMIIYGIISGFLGYFSLQYLVPKVYGKEYIEAVSIARILFFGVVPIGCALVLSGYFAGTNQFIVCTQGAVIGFICSLFFDYVLIPKYGSIGAAYASALSYITNTVYLMTVFIRSNNLKTGTLFNYKKIYKISKNVWERKYL